MSSENHNPLLASTKLPGAMFSLPSGGLFYENGELAPDVSNGEVEVFAMTAYDEILLKTPDLLLNGTAVERVIRRCVPQVLEPMQLLSRDVDFLLICIRSVSFGSEVTVKRKHTCTDHISEYTVSIDDFVSRTTVINPTTINKEYRTVLNDGKIVYMCPIRYRTMVEILTEDSNQIEEMDSNQYVEYMHDKTTGQLAQLITKVIIPSAGGQTEDIVVTDSKQIHEWVKTIPSHDIQKLNDSIDKSSQWGPELEYVVKCKHCDQDMTIDVPLNPMHFFTQR